MLLPEYRLNVDELASSRQHFSLFVFSSYSYVHVGLYGQSCDQGTFVVARDRCGWNDASDDLATGSTASRAKDRSICSGRGVAHVVVSMDRLRWTKTLRDCVASQVGSAAWNDHQAALQRLNIQAHANAMAHVEEYVAEAMATTGAINTLIINVLAHEVPVCLCVCVGIIGSRLNTT